MKPSTYRKSLAAVLLSGLVGLAGCSSMGTEDPASSARSTDLQADTKENRTGTDPVARYALSAQPGDSAQLQTSDGTQVFVTVGTMYTSAAGVRCRRITVRTQRDASRVSAVCKQADGWHTVLQP